MDVNTLIAKRIRDLRNSRGYALGVLAELSGVSRSMISLIEREETSPTAAVLNKLADALGVTLAELFSDDSISAAVRPLSQFAEQQVWKDPATGYVRRYVSPNGFVSPLELAEVTFPPWERVAFDSAIHKATAHQQIWMLDGEMEIIVGNQSWTLKTGDCLAMTLDEQIVFSNQTAKEARYLVAITTIPSSSRRS